MSGTKVSTASLQAYNAVHPGVLRPMDSLGVDLSQRLLALSLRRPHFRVRTLIRSREAEALESSLLSDSASRSAGFPAKKDFPFS